MAIAVLILLLSAILPILGVDFDWIPWHWVTGAVLTALILCHILRALLLQGLGTMLPKGHDFIRGGYAANKEAKYDIYQKSYHWTVAFVVLALILTGIPMLIKLDTIFWDRNPAIMSDLQWGYVYVVHGVATLLLIFFLILHVYFNFLPEHRQLLVSMITGNGPLHPEHEEFAEKTHEHP